jgi:uncharacterized protein with ParB-like and HNH nuclease domain
MEAFPSQIIQFFNGFKQSVIPLFQRPYEWKASNWATFWEDTLERYESPTDASHFMGAIVTMPARSVPVGVAKHLIIDGQQRLTTLALLLCAIRDELPSDAKVIRTRIQNHYLTNDGYEGLDYLKFLPTQDDRDSFKMLVSGGGDLASSDMQMHKAYEYLRQKITQGDSDGNPIDVPKLLDTIERKLIIVNINLGEAEDPYLIFESLNAKGSPLTQADLVRNYFLMKFPVTDQETVYQDLWLPMQRRLGGNLTEFMRHYLMRSGEEVLKDDVYSQLKKRVQAATEDGVKSILEEMHRLSGYYLRLIKPTEETDADLQASLLQLLRWDVTTSYPLTLKLYESYARNEVAKDEFNQCLVNIESFVIRRMVCGVATNQLKRIFLQAAKEFTPNNTLGWLRENLSSGAAGRRWPRDEEFRQGWLHYNIYSVPRRCKLILDSLETSYGHKEQAALDKATIEHVMPQTLTDEWRNMLATNEEPDKTHELFVDTIGNLTLTAYNPELSNFGFEEKKKIYAASHYTLNEYFAACKVWGSEQIVERASQLWEQAKKLWPSPNQPLDTASHGEFDEDDSDEQTNNQLLNAKREMIVSTLSECEGVTLHKVKGILYASEKGDVRAACPVSRRYPRATSPYYWYGYSMDWPAFLSQGSKSFLLLGCMDKDSAYAIPNKVVETLLEELYETPNRHWHIMLEENESGQLELSVPEKKAIPVGKYEIKLG